MKTRIFNLIILDESGSMTLIERQAVSGVNETIQTIIAASKKHEDQEHYFSLTSFNSIEIKKIYENVSASEIKEMNASQYEPNGGTPLYDAMGVSLLELKKIVAQNDKVLVTVITDGEENSSREYNSNSIKTLVNKLKDNGWVFSYIGANQNVEKVAATISINNVMSFKTTAAGTNNMFEKEQNARMRWFDRVSNKEDNLSKDYFAED